MAENSTQFCFNQTHYYQLYIHFFTKSCCVSDSATQKELDVELTESEISGCGQFITQQTE